MGTPVLVLTYNTHIGQIQELDIIWSNVKQDSLLNKLF